MIDLKKRDEFIEDNCLSNKNLVKKNTITMTISISKEIGKITSKKDFKTADFFGYSLQEFHKISKINDLMPLFIGQIHD